MDKLAERLNKCTDNIPPSSIYLQTSKGIYETAEDLWFKAYLLNAQDLSLSVLDHTLYVELRKETNDSIVWQEKYFIKNGAVNGHIYLDYTLPEGDYFLSAYSSHSFYGNELYFHALRKVKVIKEIKSLIDKKAVSAEEPPNKQIRVQFNVFPEGGHLLSGVNNRVAFKAVDSMGEPLQISGALFQDNMPIAELKSVHAGMGSFFFKPDAGKKYHIRLNRPANDTLYALPEIQENGMTMQLLKNEKDSLVFKVIQNQGAARQQVYLRLQLRGMVQMIAAGILDDSLIIKMPANNIPQGIAEVTLFDQNLNPLAERLVYVNPDKKLYIKASLSKEIYAPREKASVKIKTTDQNGNPISALLAINIYDQLYRNGTDVKDIVNHYYLSAQLRGRVYAPGYYFNPEHTDRKEALDLLLLTQGWRAYIWSEGYLKERGKAGIQLITDSVSGRLVSGNVKKRKNVADEQALMIFNAEENERQMVFTDSLGRFVLTPGDFVMGRRLYIKRFGEGGDQYSIEVKDPFDIITKAQSNRKDSYPLAGRKEEAQDSIPFSRITQGLAAVEVVAKKTAIFRDKYMGSLDSLAKLEGNTDYVGACGVLNCPAGDKDKKPVEGQIYSEYIGNRKSEITSHPFSFTAHEMRRVEYHYANFTEEELLRKYNLARIKGYYGYREFYQPVYDKENNLLPDFRNTLLWAPEVITDKNGEATVDFFCSDINTGFAGSIEGVGAQGLLGKQEFHFRVK